MTYLDYSATTPIDEEVMDTFVKSAKYIGNPNSLHKLGVEAKKLIDASTKQIADILGVKESEIIYTSGASEANNLALKGLENYSRGKHILTTNMEHSSINAPLSYLADKGYDIEMIPLTDGVVDINILKNMIREDTILVSIGAVNSETGIRQPIEKIAKIIREISQLLSDGKSTFSVWVGRKNDGNVSRFIVSFAFSVFVKIMWLYFYII